MKTIFQCIAKNFPFFRLVKCTDKFSGYPKDTLHAYSNATCLPLLFTFCSKFNLFQTCLSSSLLVHCWRGTSCVIAWHRWSNCNSGFAFAIFNSVDYTKCYARWSGISYSLVIYLILACTGETNKKVEMKCANLLWSDIAVLFPCASWESAKDWITKFTLTHVAFCILLVKITWWWLQISLSMHICIQDICVHGTMVLNVLHIYCTTTGCFFHWPSLIPSSVLKETWLVADQSLWSLKFTI